MTSDKHLEPIDRFKNMNVNQWVDYIQTLHQREIELSLERVREVYQTLYPSAMKCKIICLSGTNGKGSTAELCASIYRQAGYKVGKFTSPHLVDFNERINLNGMAVSDAVLLQSFNRVEQNRCDIPITFFEYGTLLAIDVFEQANVDVAIMEVGLGGRLDSVNILDADVAITTSIALDHTAWLGDTIEQIAFEKAGIARAKKPYILGLESPPDTLIKHARLVEAQVTSIAKDFDYVFDQADFSWSWRSQSGVQYDGLPLPFKQAGVQLSNASLALQAITVLQGSLPVKDQDVSDGIASAQIAGRCQVWCKSPLIVLDVSHNEASVKRLTDFLQEEFQPTDGSKCIAVCGMLKDKEIAKSLSQISNIVDQWHCATIKNERGASSEEIEQHIKAVNSGNKATATLRKHESVVEAYEEALATLTDRDCLVVFGSFHTVGDILRHIK